jgi:cell division protein FtsB
LDALSKYDSELKKKEWFEFQISAQDRESYWEEKAKMELGYVKNGEVVYKVRATNLGVNHHE